MKNSLYKTTLAAILLSSASLQAQEWKQIGDVVTTNNKLTLAVASNGKLYTAYNNTMNGINVKTFDGKKWTLVGKPDFSGISAELIHITTAQDGTPYVAYRCRKRGTTEEKAWVEKFDGKEWVLVGADAISTGSINNITLAFDNNNQLYCAFADHKRGKLSVNQLVNNNWEEIASPQDLGLCDDITIRFTKSNMPVIAYADTKNGRKVTVKSYNGTQWTLIGTTPASDREGKYINLELDSKGNPVVAYQYTWDGKILVKKFDGKAWTSVGGPVYETSNDNISMTLDAQDLPYVAYHVNKSNHPIEVKKFDGAVWTKLNDPGLGRYYTIVTQKQGTLYITFQESDKGGVVKQLTQ